MKYKELHLPVSRGKEILKLLTSKYQSLDASIVISSRWGQVDPGTTGGSALRTFAKLFSECEQKTVALQILQQLNQYSQKEKYARGQEAEFTRKKVHELTNLLNQLAETLPVDEMVNVELRFGELQYELVWALQQDSLIDHGLTPQTRSSIRIVLGTLKALRETGGSNGL